MEEAHLTHLEELVMSHSGLRVRDRETLRRGAAARMKQLGLSQADEYLQMLVNGTDGARLEWRRLVTFLTNPESHFFRDLAQMALLRDTLLPELIARNRSQRRLRLWSAGCSTGQEPYSLAVLIHELLSNRTGWDISILGTDINDDALDAARHGVYQDWSFRAADPVIRQRYFRRVTGDYQIDELLRSMVTFRYHNLVQDACPDAAAGLQEMDLILCRNVFIYFAPKIIGAVLPKLAAALREGGYLITGHAEIQNQPLESLKMRMCPEAAIYQRMGAFPARRAPSEAGSRARSTEHEARSGTTAAQSAKRKAQSGMEAGRPAASSALRSELCALRSERSEPEYQSLCQTARAQANRGDLTGASDCCRRAVALDPLAPTAYQLLASIADERGNRNEARDLLRKVIYLAPESATAYLELGAIYASEGDAARAGKMRRAAVDLLRALPPVTAVEPWGEVTAGELLRHIEATANGEP